MISLIIVDYNSMKETMKFINHTINKIFDFKLLNVIIIDNSPEDLNFKMLCELHDNISDVTTDYRLYDKYNSIDKAITCKYKGINIVGIKSNKNLGFAKANNLGAIISHNIFNDDYYLFSNNDLFFKESFNIMQLTEKFKHDNTIGILGPKITGINGEAQSPRKKMNIFNKIIRRYFNMMTFAKWNKKNSDIDYDGKSGYKYWVMGCFFIVDSNKFNEVGMFDENTFLYGEEMILSERMNNKGYSVYFLNDIEVIHYQGGTTKNVLDSIGSEEISFKSNIYYFEQYRKTSRLMINISKVSFAIYKCSYPWKMRAKNKMNGDETFKNE